MGSITNDWSISDDAKETTPASVLSANPAGGMINSVVNQSKSKWLDERGLKLKTIQGWGAMEGYKLLPAA